MLTPPFRKRRTVSRAKRNATPVPEPPGRDDILDGMDQEALRALIAKAEERLVLLEGEGREKAFAAVEKAAEAAGLTEAELRARFGGVENVNGTAVRFRHPETGETWAGRGRKPNWVKDYEAKGGNLDDVAVEPPD